MRTQATCRQFESLAGKGESLCGQRQVRPEARLPKSKWVIRAQKSGRLRMVRRGLVRQNWGREAKGVPGAEGERPADSEARGKDVKMEHQGRLEEGTPMAKGRGWHGGGAVGRGEKREASTLGGIFRSCYSPSNQLARNEHLVYPGQRAGPCGHKVCHT